MTKRTSSSRRKFITAGFAEQSDPDRTGDDCEIQQSMRYASRQYSHLEQFTKSAMACQFELLFNMHQYRNSGEASLRAFSMIDQFEDQMSIYRTTSELSNINRVADTETVSVEPRLFALLMHSREIFEQTGGAFDITARPLSEIWGFHRRAGQVPTQQAIKTALSRTGMRYVDLNATDSEIRLKKKGTKLDLGGIGKGFAIDQVVHEIVNQGIQDFVIHGGQSSVAARGICLQSKQDSDQALGWKIGLSHPLIPDCRLAEVVLENSALATSGTQRQGFFHHGKRYGHIIDPRTGYPTDHCLSSTVICDSAARADALATAFFVMKLDEVQQYCDNHRDTTAIMVVADGDLPKIQIEAFNADNLNWKKLPT